MQLSEECYIVSLEAQKVSISNILQLFNKKEVELCLLKSLKPPRPPILKKKMTSFQRRRGGCGGYIHRESIICALHLYTYLADEQSVPRKPSSAADTAPFINSQCMFFLIFFFASLVCLVWPFYFKRRGTTTIQPSQYSCGVLAMLCIMKT